MRLVAFFSAAFAALFAFSAFANEDRWKREGWTTDFSKISVEQSSILSGGPPKDGIPPIDDPKFISVSEEKTLTPRDPVIGLDIDGDARAYPLRIMTWHEIVNDTVGGKPVAVTYCPLCNAAIVFDAKVDGRAHSFGTTGKLRNSDLIMYDRATESWWQQFTGEAIAGAHLGKKLMQVPARLESWADFRTRHPGGKVLVPNNPDMRAYGRNPYVNYDISAQPFLYRGSMPEGISPMARVVVVRDSEVPNVVALQKVRDAGSLEIGKFNLSWKTGQASALHSEDISKGRDVGTVTAVDRATGKPMPYDVTFAFVAHAFHPEVEIVK